MKKFLLFILGAFLFVSCSKSSGGNVKPVTTASLSGRYVLYQTIDTDYNANQSISNILIENSTGAIEYLNPGTPYYSVENNPIAGGYNPVIALADTLTFTSATEGTENNSFGRNSFKYSLKNNTYDDGGDPAASSITVSLIQLNSSSIEVLFVQKPNGALQDSGGTYWKKL